MEDSIFILFYGGIAVLISLLIFFEVKERGTHKTRSSHFREYEYYTESGIQLRIYHTLPFRYKVYVCNKCPVPIKNDRYGTFFTINAWNVRDVECQIDKIFQGRIDS